MLKMTIDNEEVVSDKDITINEEMLSASSTILNNVYPKEWEEDKDYTSKFYYPQDYSKALIQRSYVTQEAEAGTTIQVNGSATLTDVDTTKNSRVLRLLGQTSQSGTPTPSSPIPVNVVSGDNEIVVCGKNLFDKSTAFLNKMVTGSGGLIDFTGVFSSDYIKVQPSTDYYVNQYMPTVVAFDKNKNSLGYIRNASGGATFTTANNCEYIRARMFDASIDMTTALNNAMLNLGTSATTYEPYIGNTYNIDLPVENLLSFANYTNISGTSSLGVTRTFDGETIILNGTTTSAGNIVGKSSTGIILKAGTYTGSITTSGSYNRPSGDVAFYLRKNNTASGMFGIPLTNMATDGQYSVSFILTEDTEVFLEIYASASNISFNNYTCKFQIEKGLKANSYTPYGTTPIELCKIGTYQDYFYKDSGKWYLHKEIGKYVFTGNETGVLQNSGKRFDITCLDNNIPICINNSTPSEVSQIYCNILLASSGASTWGGNQGISYNTGTNGQILVSISGATTTQAYLSALKDNYCYYILATPTDTEITYTELLNQLNALSSQ